MTDVTVITNTATAVKMMIKHPTLLPTVALVDPLLTVSSPPAVTASSGLDALCHAVEAYLSRRAQPLTDALALSAVRRIAGHLRRAYANGQDLEAREAMALAAMEAGMAFSNASVALVHGMSRPVGALFHVPHGIANAMLMPAVLEYTKPACVARLAVIGRAMCPDVAGASDEEAAEEASGKSSGCAGTWPFPTSRPGGWRKRTAREGEQDGRRRLGQRQPRQQPARADAGGHCCSL